MARHGARRPSPAYGTARGSDGNPEAGDPARGPPAAAERRPDLLRGHAGPARARPAGGGGGRSARRALPLRGEGDAPRAPALQGPAGDPRVGLEPHRGRGPRAGRRSGAAARDDHPPDAHARPAVHLRQPEELPAEAGPAGVLGHPPDLHGAAAVGADHGPRRGPGGRQQGELLLLPDGRGPVEGGTAPDRARGVLPAQGRLPRGGRLRGHGAGLPGDGAPAARPPRRRAGASLLPRLPRVAPRRQLHLHGHRLLRRGAGRHARPHGRDGERRLHRPRAPPRRLPGRRRARRDPPQPAAERRPDPRPRLLRERLGHLPPRADRGPHRARVGRGREALGGHPAARPLRPRGLHPARRPHPDPQGEGGPSPRALRGHPELPRLARDPGRLQPLPEDRPLLRGRRRPGADHPAHRARGERRRDRGRGPQGSGLRGPLRGLLAAALRLPDRGGPAARLRRRVRPGGLRHLGGLRARHAPHLLLRLEPARAPGGRRGGAPAHRAPRHRLGGPRRRRPRARVRGARGPAALPPLRDAGVAQRPLPRGDGAGAGAERPAADGGAREPARGAPSSRRRRRPPPCSCARCARSTSPTP